MMTQEKSGPATFSVEDAKVQERQVTVRVLTIGTKQVTQSLYKQLVHEDILDDQARIKGNVWGWVNFHHEACRGSHLHVIWDDGEMLKKCTLFQSPGLSSDYSELKSDWYNLGKAYICALFLEGVLQDSDGSDRKFQINGRSITVPITNSIRTLVAWQDTYNRPHNGTEYQEKQISQCQEELKKEMREYLNKAFTYVSSSSDIRGEMEETEKSLTRYENIYTESYNTIQQAGQLFIAVSGVWK